MPKNTNATRERRLMALEKFMDDMDFQGKHHTKQDMLNHLKNKKFAISRETLRRDLEELSSNNTFVENVGMYYSKYMDDISKTYDRIEREAWKIFNREWDQSKATKKEVIDKNGVTRKLDELTITKEIAGPKLGALKIIADIEKQRQELASGKNLELSAAMWIKKTREYEEQIKGLKIQLSKKHKEVIEIGN